MIFFFDFRLHWSTANELYYDLDRKKIKGLDYNTFTNDLLYFDRQHS